jgi:hypothetical protein
MKARIEDNQIAQEKFFIKKPVVTRQLLCNSPAFMKLEVSLTHPEVLVTGPYRQQD